MGKNLTRLFELSKSNMAGPEEWKAPFKLEQLFKAHGEALIAALDEAGEIIHSEFCGKEHHKHCLAITQLLDTLEREAQP